MDGMETHIGKIHTPNCVLTVWRDEYGKELCMSPLSAELKWDAKWGAKSVSQSYSAPLSLAFSLQPQEISCTTVLILGVFNVCHFPAVLESRAKEQCGLLKEGGFLHELYGQINEPICHICAQEASFIPFRKPHLNSYPSSSLGLIPRTRGVSSSTLSSVVFHAQAKPWMKRSQRWAPFSPRSWQLRAISKDWADLLCNLPETWTLSSLGCGLGCHPSLYLHWPSI